MNNYRISWEEVLEKQIIIEANSKEQAFEIWESEDREIMEDMILHEEIGDPEIEERL